MEEVTITLTTQEQTNLLQLIDLAVRYQGIQIAEVALSISKKCSVAPIKLEPEVTP